MEKFHLKTWLSLLWPIHKSELKKFLPMFFIFFLIAFNYNILRSYKDSIVITASESGAEVIPFIKVWIVLPSAVAFTLLFSRLSSHFSREKVFYIILSIFLVFFFLFGFVLYPLKDLLHPNALADVLQQTLPAGFKGLIAIFRNWTFSLFYVMSELWSTTVFSVLFWGFANEVTSVFEAKRFYGMLTAIGNLAGLFSGFAALKFSENIFIPWIPYGKNSWDQSILFLTIAVIFCGLVTIFLFRWLNLNVIRHIPHLNEKEEKKSKMSIRENISLLAKSKYLLYIALIVFAYNVAINLVEVVWKDQVKALYPSPTDYNAYMAKVMIVMAVIASFGGIITTSNVIGRNSWTFSALIPPVILASSGVLFFQFVLFPKFGITFLQSLISVSPLMICVTLGSIQNCLSRASKYTFFDATKEIAFIPLSKEEKLKGKAAIDGIGSRLGKSGGSVIYQGLILAFSSVSASVPYVAIIFFAIIVVWVYSVTLLGKQFDQVSQQKITT